MILVAIADSIAVVTRIPEVVRVQETGGIGSRDVGSWAVQAVIALVAAWLGAVFGARATRKVTAESQAAELKEEWRRRRVAMLQRLSSALAHNKGWSQGMLEHNPTLPVSSAMVEGARHVWSRYTALVDDLFLLEDVELVKRVEAYFIKLNAMAAMFEDLEAQRMREAATPSITGESVENRINRVDAGTAAKRSRLLGHVREADREGEELIRYYDAYVQSRNRATAQRDRPAC